MTMPQQSAPPAAAAPTRPAAETAGTATPAPASVDRPAEQIAVLVPCYNEETTIAKVVSSFRAALPGARVYVYDNASSDLTSVAARGAGAIVVEERNRGKGNVVRRMFADVDADIYVLVDGDDTYDAAAVPALIELLLTRQLDMVNGARRGGGEEAYRPGHRFGNALFTHLVGTIFGRQFDDILSGYRVLSRRFVKSFPAVGRRGTRPVAR